MEVYGEGVRVLEEVGEVAVGAADQGRAALRRVDVVPDVVLPDDLRSGVLVCSLGEFYF